MTPRESVDTRWTPPLWLQRLRAVAEDARGAEISLFLADDVPELRELIRWGMEEDPGFRVIGEAGDGRSAVAGVAETRPAAVLLDLSMPDMNGPEAISLIRERDPKVARRRGIAHPGDDAAA